VIQTATLQAVGFAITMVSATNVMLRVIAWRIQKDPAILEAPIVAVVREAVAPAEVVVLVEAVPEDAAAPAAPNEAGAEIAIPVRKWDVVSVQKPCAPIQ